MKNSFINCINDVGLINPHRKLSFCVCLFLLFVLVMFFGIQKQIGPFVDEILSYNLANSRYGVQFNPTHPVQSTVVNFYDKYLSDDTWSSIMAYVGDASVKGLKDSQLRQDMAKIKNDWKEYRSYEHWVTREDLKMSLAVDDNTAFNIASVYWNQQHDVHPPLYYIFLNVVSSIFAGSFSVWYALGLNIFFYILTLIGIYCIVYVIFNRFDLGIYSMLLYGGSVGAISTVMLLRMYTMLTFFIVIFTLFLLKYIKNQTKNHTQNKSVKWLRVSVILGMLTHYYFIIYLFLAGGLAAVYLFLTKQKTNLVVLLKIICQAGIVALFLFPFMVQHILFSNRGIANVTSVEFQYIKNIFEYIHILFLNMAGEFVLLILSVILLLCKQKYLKISLQKIESKITLWLIIVVFVYIGVIAKLAPYQVDRYIMCIYPIFTISVVSLFYYLYGQNDRPALVKKIVLVIVCFAVCSNLYLGKVQYLYPQYEERLATLQAYKNISCIYIYHDPVWQVAQSLPELIRYKKVLFVRDIDVDKISDRDTMDREAVVYIQNNSIYGDDVLLEKLPYHSLIKINDTDYVDASVYFLQFSYN